ncbi:MAG TPA: sugar ABC transporter ATP-binding protein [Planctomycetota bacterium]|nr:sugar ABC transporter ATP-binding protein [Planctomycetota bacterium]
MTAAVLIETRDLGKTYGTVRALGGVGVTIRAGEIHALIGENGAGKSTFINLLAGVVTPTTGTVSVAGVPLALGVRASEAAGIAVIHQESTAFQHLDALDNLFVGREPRRWGGLFLDKPRMRSEAKRLLESLGETLHEGRPLAELSVAARQMIAIARALSVECRLLILDEPTASLSSRECEALFTAIRRLKATGVAILYVSHRLEEILTLADRVTVLRDGSHIETRDAAGLSKDDLIRAMVGRDVIEHECIFGISSGVVRLSVRGLTRAPRFRDVSFEIRAGEIVGMAGLVGAGRSDVAAAIFGADPADAGEVVINGRLLPTGDLRAAIAAGIALVPEDRQHLGLVLPMTVGENLVLTVLSSLARGGLRSIAAEAAVATAQMQAMAVKAASPQVVAKTLSGGNQQKLVIGKWLATKPTVLILDEPTRGIDVGARAEIYRLIRRLAAEGMATLVISSDLPEVLGLSHRVLVMREGRISGELSRAQATPEQVLALAMPQETAVAASASAGRAP